jgi:hypothetical protein
MSDDPGAAHPCPPGSVTVNGYYRAARRRRHRPAEWWECQQRSGTWCGVKHGSIKSSLAHCVILNKLIRRKSLKYQGKLDMWDAKKRTERKR